jgi:quercetin dioxygenase-like cupin family protein
VDRPSSSPVTVDLVSELADAAGGADGVVWAFETSDLDTNLVRLSPHGGIAAHRNDEVDVVVLVHAGTGTLSVDGAQRPLGPHTLAVLRRGATRAITAGAEGLVYVTVHRRRRGLGIAGRTPE